MNSWRDFVVTARHVEDTTGHPLIIAGDANVWHPHFILSRSRSWDASIIPLIDLLTNSCRLALSTPRDRVPHPDGAGLAVVFWHQLVASDHCLCIARKFLSVLPGEARRTFTLLPDWKLTLVRARPDLVRWSAQILMFSDSSPWQFPDLSALAGSQ